MFTDNMKNSHMQNVFYEGFIVLKHEHEVEDVKSRNLKKEPQKWREKKTKDIKWKS